MLVQNPKLKRKISPYLQSHRTKRSNNVLRQSTFHWHTRTCSFQWLLQDLPPSASIWCCLLLLPPKVTPTQNQFSEGTAIQKKSCWENDEERNLLFISVLLATPASLSVFPHRRPPDPHFGWWLSFWLCFNSGLISYFPTTDFLSFFSLFSSVFGEGLTNLVKLPPYPFLRW